MKISPTAIRQKVFDTSFRGYEKKQVTDFLEEMSVIMEQINQENLDLRSRLQQVEGEAKRLKDVEDSLFRTLKTAEDTGAAIITEATEAADEIIAEANQLAEETTKDAQRYAEDLGAYSVEQARIITTAAEESAKETMRSLSENIKGLVKSYEGLVEQREALVKSLRRLSQDALNQIDLSETHFARIDAKAYQRAVEELSRSNHFSAANAAHLAPVSQPSLVQLEEPQPVIFEEEVSNPNEVAEEEAFSSEDENSLFHEEEISEISDEVQEEDLVDSLEGVAFDEGEEKTQEEEYKEGEVAEDELPEDEFPEENEPEAKEIQTSTEPIQGSPFSEDEKKKEEKGESGSGSFFDQFD
ncbi:MAG: DivIVA domain-containing protein [Algoriphagus sp.]|nr:DivIVA domain-containing protein [Algoriphagus sp.]